MASLQSPSDMAAHAKLQHLYQVVTDFLALLHPDTGTGADRTQDQFKVLVVVRVGMCL